MLRLNQWWQKGLKRLVDIIENIDNKKIVDKYCVNINDNVVE